VKHVTKVLGNFGSSLKDKLNAIASTAQNKQEKDIVSGVLSLGVTLANKGKDYIEKNEDAD
ncbi:Phospholipase A and acyltransferase 3, partial [Biomphalaria glabrata]